MKLAKLVREYILKENSNLHKLIFYRVTYQTSDFTETLYEGTDLKKAKLEYDSFSHSDMEKRLYNHTVYVELEKSINVYKFVYELDNENEESADDYPIEDYYEDSDIYELVEEGDFDVIKNREIKPINDKSDSLLFDVNQYFKSKYGNSKYNTIYVNDNESNCIQLRIADHTENISNNDKYVNCDYYISVVITDYDVTKNKFKISNHFDRNNNEYTLNFNSDDNIEDIIENIEKLIKNLSSKLKK